MLPLEKVLTISRIISRKKRPVCYNAYIFGNHHVVFYIFEKNAFFVKSVLIPYENFRWSVLDCILPTLRCLKGTNSASDYSSNASFSTLSRLINLTWFSESFGKADGFILVNRTRSIIKRA